MTVSSLTGSSSAAMQNNLTSMLESKGLSADKAKEVSSEIDKIAQSSMSSGKKPDPTSMRSAIEDQLKKDVAGGVLTDSEASQVTSALDALDAKMKAGGGPQGAGGPPPGGPPPGGPPPGPGGSSSSSSSSSSSTMEELLKMLESGSKTTSASSSTTDSASSSKTDTTTAANWLKQLLSSSIFGTNA